MSVFVFVLFLFFFWKELIQNAEDAGASQVKFLHDKHSYGKEKLHSQKLATFQVSFVKELAKNEQCRVSNSLYRDKHLGYFFLFSITKYLLTILTYKQCMVLTLLTKLYSTYKTILIYNVRYLRY